MAVAVMCPACGRTGRAPDGCEGKAVRCGACGSTFRVPAPSRTSAPASSPPPRVSVTPRNLESFAAGRGHPEFPCLSRQYSPTSRIPCADFSRWLCDRIEANDAEAVAEFVWRTVEGNPGVGLGNDGFREHWQKSARQLLERPLDMHLSGGTPRAYLELRAALVLILLHDTVGGFIMASDAPRYLATVMMPHGFQPAGVEQLAKRANAFIREMRKDTPFWEDFPLFRVGESPPWPSPPDPAAQGFCAELRLLPLGSRSHFFDAVAPLLAQKGGGQQALDQASSYMTRKRGLDGAESAALLLKSGLLVRSDDLRAFLQGMSVHDLVALLSREGVEFRKSWKKEKLVSAVLDRCPAAAQAAAQGMVLADIAFPYAEAARWARAEIDRITPLFQMWLEFGVDPII
jgi:hypothetical protein